MPFHAPRLTAIALVILSSRLAAAQPSAAVAATTPVPRDDAWWIERHADKLAEKADASAAGREIRVVFLGDSITHGWEQAGEALWDERFAPHGALNLGFSGDRTEHVLWRLGLGDAGEENNEIAGLTPRLFVVMIGTNNTGHNQTPAQETAAGVGAIVDRLHEVSPASRVLLLAVFPRGAKADDPLRRRNAAVNERIARLGERDDVTFLDINDVFLAADGGLPPSVMPDLLHPSVEGYRRWADAITPVVERIVAGD